MEELAPATCGSGRSWRNRSHGDLTRGISTTEAARASYDAEPDQVAETRNVQAHNERVKCVVVAAMSASGHPSTFPSRALDGVGADSRPNWYSWRPRRRDAPRTRSPDGGSSTRCRGLMWTKDPTTERDAWGGRVRLGRGGSASSRIVANAWNANRAAELSVRQAWFDDGCDTL